MAICSMRRPQGSGLTLWLSLLILALATPWKAAGQTCVEWTPLVADAAPAPLKKCGMWDPDGEGPRSQLLVVAGSPSFIGGIAASGIAVRNENGQWEGLGGGIVANDVDAIESGADGSLFVAGDIQSAGGQPVNRVARWDGSQWHALGLAMNGRVRALQRMPNGDIIAAGDFTWAGTVAANRVARWDGTRWWSLGSGINGSVRALCVTDEGVLLAGGQFTTAGGTPVQGIAQWNGAEWLASGAVVQPGGRVNALLKASDGSIYAGGSIARGPSNQWDHQLARYVNGVWTVVPEVVIGDVLALAELPGGRLVIGGDLSWIDGVRIYELAIRSNGQWQALPPITNNIRAMCIDADGRLAIAGDFQSCGKRNLLRLMPWGWDDYITGINNQVSAILAVSSDEVYIGGPFFSFERLCVGNLVHWDGTRWNPLGDGISGRTAPSVTKILKMPDGDLVVLGRFDYAGREVVNSVARWNGSDWHAFGNQVLNFDHPGTIRSGVFLPNGDLVVCGVFTFNDRDWMRVARWNGSEWIDLRPPVEIGEVSNVAVLPSGDLVAQGRFGTSPNYTWLQRWDGQNWTAVNWPISGSTPRIITTLNDGDLVLGGGPLEIVRWDGVTWEIIPPPPSVVGNIYSIDELPNGEWLVATNNGVWRLSVHGWRPVEESQPRRSDILSVIPGTESFLVVDNGSVSYGGGLFLRGLYLGRITGDAIRIEQQPVPPLQGCTAIGIDLTVIASGTGPISYRWKRSGFFIDPETNPSAATSTLRVTSLNTGSNIFSCEITGPCGAVTTPDYIVGGRTSGAVCCRADWDRSGGVDGDDIAAFFEDWQMGEADIDQSGGTDGDDIAFFFTRWQAGC